MRIGPLARETRRELAKGGRSGVERVCHICRARWEGCLRHHEAVRRAPLSPTDANHCTCMHKRFSVPLASAEGVPSRLEEARGPRSNGARQHQAERRHCGPHSSSHPSLWQCAERRWLVPQGGSHAPPLLAGVRVGPGGGALALGGDHSASSAASVPPIPLPPSPRDPPCPALWPACDRRRAAATLCSRASRRAPCAPATGEPWHHCSSYKSSAFGASNFSDRAPSRPQLAACSTHI